jgi:hypothetical protein
MFFFGNCPGMEIASTEGRRQRKRFFFEKKNQKTFTNSGLASAERPKPIEQKFFASFFQKRRPSCCLPYLRPPTWAVVPERPWPEQYFYAVLASQKPCGQAKL